MRSRQWLGRTENYHQSKEDQMTAWQEKLVLKAGESLKHERSYMKGPLQETDVDLYVIVNAQGDITGEVKLTDHTAIRGFQRTISVIQTDRAGNTVVNESWNP
ncbi:hypothetical protein WQE_16384 [Paraburkholderia hospita]|uniref:BON domain-containing protein n=2 Tax=Paraburkholderia hospita TaxID=169430 RepID=A0ABN0FMF2_9BURK|nr:hypothetical protein WQE_16384 [Paraburkholderia hospita]